MYNYALLIAGISLVLVVLYDFFYTTLSSSGSAFITRTTSSVAHKTLRFMAIQFGRKVFSASGMVVNIAVLTTWLLVLWLGLFLIYSSDPEGIVNGTGRTATPVERIYFTGYVLSTLGIGNFKPISPFFELLTSIFSFFGFVFFTASITYLLSVSSAVIHKRSLAWAIGNLGKSTEEFLVAFRRMDSSFRQTQVALIKNMIEKHSVNHHAYPVVHYYNSADRLNSFSINFVRLDKVVQTMLTEESSETVRAEFHLLKRSITQFLEFIEDQYNTSWKAKMTDDSSKSHDRQQSHNTEENGGDLKRKRILEGLLRSESFSWSDI